MEGDSQEFTFLPPFEDETINGLYLNDIYLPEEVLQNILSYVPTKLLLELTLVCKKWCNIIKSGNLWMHIYNRHYPKKAKKLPWYVFYCYFTTDDFDNLLKNGNGSNKFKHWKIVRNGGDRFQIENPPRGCDPLPSDVPDFNGCTSCFVTSYSECKKIQKISLQNRRLLQYILNKFMPHIYVSEWVAGRFDCGCKYTLDVKGYTKEYIEHRRERSAFSAFIPPLFHKSRVIVIQQWEGKAWEKVEILIEEYPPNLATVIFEHAGRDTQFWAGHYGSKMAGGVVRFLFDSIQPLEDKTKMSDI